MWHVVIASGSVHFRRGIRDLFLSPAVSPSLCTIYFSDGWRMISLVVCPGCEGLRFCDCLSLPPVRVCLCVCMYSTCSPVNSAWIRSSIPSPGVDAAGRQARAIAIAVAVLLWQCRGGVTVLQYRTTQWYVQ